MKREIISGASGALRLHAADGRLEREVLLETWERAIATAIQPGMAPEQIATLACMITVETLQGRIYFGRVHANLFRDRLIAQLGRTGNSDELGRSLGLTGRRVRQIIAAKRSQGAR